MKISFALTALILAIGVTIGWRDHVRLVSLNSKSLALSAVRHQPAVALEPATSPGKTAQMRRPRPQAPEETHAAAKRLLAVVRALDSDKQARKNNPGRPRIPSAEPFTALESLNAEELKFFLTTLHADTTVDPWIVESFSDFGLMVLARLDGRTALELRFSRPESAPRQDQGRAIQDHGRAMMEPRIVQLSLSQWAKQDPLAALEWTKEYSVKSPEMAREMAIDGLLGGAASKDPKLAISMLDQLDIRSFSSAGSVLGNQTQTPEARNAVVSAMREYLAGTTDPKKTAALQTGFFSTIAQGMQGGDFNESVVWLENAKLSPDESVAFASGISEYAAKKDLGKWIGWMAANLPSEPLRDKVESIFVGWVNNDVEAAGTWLAQAPDDAAKIPAVRVYVRTVARYEPQNAEQWAMTLPAGGDRDQTMREIHQSWPVNDPNGKAAFAARHGLK
jgi:hypothetical protein